MAIDGDGDGDKVAGRLIKQVYRNADHIADLHACLTSPRGDNFRFRLLQVLEAPMRESEVERLRIESGINEYHRHLNRILSAGLARVEETGGERKYLRTELGETAVNSVRSFARRVGEPVAQVVFAAALGTNSIRFFLRIYDDRREPDWDNLQIRYTAAEIGRLSFFLPRTIDGISAVDKLNDADLLTYRDDNHIYVQASRARSWYQYLKELNGMVVANRALSENWTVDPNIGNGVSLSGSWPDRRP